MSNYYLDSSAIAKRYLAEIGSAWIRALTDPTSGHSITLAEITRVEVAAALAARHRAPGGITRQEHDHAINLLSQHWILEYTLAPATRPILNMAVDLTQRHRLRGYDAVQLATALVTNASLSRLGSPT